MKPFVGPIELQAYFACAVGDFGYIAESHDIQKTYLDYYETRGLGGHSSFVRMDRVKEVTIGHEHRDFFGLPELKFTIELTGMERSRTIKIN